MKYKVGDKVKLKSIPGLGDNWLDGKKGDTYKIKEVRPEDKLMVGFDYSVDAPTTVLGRWLINESDIEE